MTARYKVIAVDDSSVSLMNVERHLRDTSFDLAAKINEPEKVLEIFSELRPDLVLLDLVMPNMDGVSILRELKRVDEDVKVIMVSSMGSKDKVVECVMAGATNFLMKPYDKAALVKILTASVEGDSKE